MSFGLKVVDRPKATREVSKAKPQATSYATMVAERKKTIRELDAEVARMKARVLELHCEAIGFYSFEAAVLTFGGVDERHERYQYLTRWLHSRGYKCSDILWVGIAILSQSPHASSFWLTRATAAKWHLTNPQKLAEWLLEKGLVTRRGETGKDSYNFCGTPLLQSILSGEPAVLSVK